MNDREMMGYARALRLTLDTISPLPGREVVELGASLGRVLCEDLYSRVNSPSIDASMKDGYALRSEDIREAAADNPVRLTVTGVCAAGATVTEKVYPGTAMRILTGGKIPDGADAVLAEEFSTRQDDLLTAFNIAEPGRNIMPKGADVCTGELIARQGSCLTPGMIGIIAAAGLGELPVTPIPRVAILATGDELTVPGRPLPDGKLYASNLEMLKAWCRRYGMPTTFSILKDEADLIRREIRELVATHDALITSGGAWTGDRDFTGATLDRLGWEKQFHSIRIGPGKPVGFGLLDKKPIFLLPGGPPSNLTAFLQIALPGLMRLGGHHTPSLPRVMVKLGDRVKSRGTDWTQFIYGHLEMNNDDTLFTPLKLTSRLKSIAGAEAVIAVPEGVDALPRGAVVSAQLLI